MRFTSNGRCQRYAASSFALLGNKSDKPRVRAEPDEPKALYASDWSTPNIFLIDSSGKAIMYCQGRDIEYIELRMHFDTDVMRWIVENEPATQKNRDNIVLSAVYLFIRERIHFEGTATELVAELKTVTDEVIYPNRVTRDLVQNGYELSKYGIDFKYERVHKGRIIILHYNGERVGSDGRNVTVTQALPDSSQSFI